MEKEIKIAEVISSDVRSRSNAEIIRKEIIGTSHKVVLDFSGVTFISRSFTDELYSIVNSFKNRTIEFINTSDVVSAMITAVKNGRENKRVRTKDNSKIKEFDDLDSLAAFLATM